MSGFPDRRFQDAMLKEIRQRYDDAERHLISGMANDFADYRYRIGFLHGLEAIVRWSEEVARQMNETRRD